MQLRSVHLSILRYNKFLERCSAVLQRLFPTAALCLRVVLSYSSPKCCSIGPGYSFHLCDFGIGLHIVIMLEYSTSAKLLEPSCQPVFQYLHVLS